MYSSRPDIVCVFCLGQVLCVLRRRGVFVSRDLEHADLLILLACFADYAVRRHRDDPRFSLQHVVAGPRPGRVHHERTRVSSRSLKQLA